MNLYSRIISRKRVRFQQKSGVVCYMQAFAVTLLTYLKL